MLHAGIILISVAIIILLPMFISICSVVADWFIDAVYGRLFDEYSFYWFGLLFAIACLILGIVFVYNCRVDQPEQTTTIQQVETNNGNE